MKHSTWAVPKWREGDVLHPVQVTREARQVEVEGAGGGGGRGWALSGQQKHSQREEGVGGSDDLLLYRWASPLLGSGSPHISTLLERPPDIWECKGPGVKM